MKSLDEWLPYVLPETPGCPETVVLRAVMSAVIEFARRTHCWVHTTEAIPAVQGVADYVFDVPAGAEVWSLLAVNYKGKPLSPKNTVELDAAYPGWRARIGVPRFYVKLDEAEVVLDAKPAATERDVLTASFALTPERDKEEVGDVFYRDWLEEIAEGAKHRLMKMPGRKWTNPAGAEEANSLFQEGIARARANRNKRNGTHDLRVNFRRIV